MESKGNSKKRLIIILAAVIICVAILTTVFLLLFFGKESDELTNKDQGDQGNQVTIDEAIEAIEDMTIVAENSNEYGILGDTDFIIETEVVEGLTTELLKRHLVLEPAIDYDLTDEGDGTYRMKLSSAIESDSIVKISLVREREDFGWAFQTEALFGMTRSLPTNDAYSAPLDTGIEMVFNHDAPQNIETFFSITPSVSGQISYNKNIVTFVPDVDLLPYTQYEVTIDAGYGYEDDYLTEPVVFTFTSEYYYENETPITFTNSNQLLVQGETQHIDFAINDDTVSGADVDLTMYKLPNDSEFMKGINNLKTLRNKDDILSMIDYDNQSTYSSIIKTSGEAYVYEGWIDLDQILDTGFYLIRMDIEGSNFYQFAQVSPYQAYVAQDADELLIWAMDSITDTPAGNLYVYVNNDLYGVTDADGICQTTIGSLSEEDIDFVVLTDEQNSKLVVDMQLTNGWAYNDYPYGYNSNKLYWTYLDTDRDVYLPTDDIHLFGFVQSRSGNKPESVTVKLKGYQAEIDSAQLELSDIGTYEMDFHIEDFYFGGLYIEVWDESELITSQYISVSEFALPTYKLDIETNKDTFMMSDSVDVTVQTSFYDGTPASGSNVEISSYGWSDYLNGNEESVTLQTDASGNATTTIVPYVDGDSWYPTYFTINGTNMSYQNYYNYSQADMIVFRRDTMVEATSEVADGILTIAGHVHNIDINGFDGNIYSYDSFRGTPQVGTNLSVEITERYTEKVFIGQAYDAINHVSYDDYEYNQISNVVMQEQVVTDGTGLFSLDFSNLIEGRSYDISISTLDTKGRNIIETLSYYENGLFGGTYEGPISDYYSISITTDKWEYALGEEASIWLNYNDYLIQDTEKNYAMYIICQEGFKKYIFSNDLTTEYIFDESSIPNVSLKGVYYDGSKMISLIDRDLYYNYEEQQLDVTIETDLSSYSVGDSVTTKVTIKDASGNPVIADFSLSVIDEAYFDIFGTWDTAIDELYMSVFDDGLIQIGMTSSFQQPNYFWGAEGGDGYAEGFVREDFEITADYLTGTTNASGTANLVFELPDNLTNWRITAIALSEDLKVGESTHNIITTQPFYANVTMADKYIVGDDIKLTVNSAGTALVGQTDYTATVHALDSDMTDQVLAIQGEGLAYVSIPLGQLEIGRYEVTVEATNGDNSDAIKLPFEVVETYQAVKVLNSEPLDDNYEVPDTGHMASLYMINQGATEHFSNLYGFYTLQSSARIDMKIAATVAGMYMNDIYGSELDLDLIDNLSAYMPTGLFAETTYSGEDPILTAEILSLQTEGILDDYINDVLAESLETYMQYDWISIDERYATLWGRASLNKPVLLDLYTAIEAEEARTTDLTNAKLYGLLALVELGDLEKAKNYYNELIDQFTTSVNDKIMLNNGDRKMTAYFMLAATKLELMADADMLYSTLSDKIDIQDSTVIERLIYTIANKPEVADASFTINVGSDSTDVVLNGFDSYGVDLTKEQVGDVTFDQIEGDITVNTTYIGTPQDMEINNDIQISRAYSINGEPVNNTNVHQGDIIDVTITVTMPEDIWGIQIEDVLPSGMVYYNSSYDYESIIYYKTEGKEVVITAYRPEDNRTIVANYQAIASSQGTYTSDYLVVQNLLGIGGNYIDQEEVVINP